jgi:hypothetical protein
MAQSLHQARANFSFYLYPEYQIEAGEPAIF